MRALLVLVLLAGCDRLLGLGAISAASDASASDGNAGDVRDDSAVDAGLTTCLSDSFATATINTAVWTKFSNATAPVPQVSQASGVIEVTLQAEVPPTPPYNGLVSLNAFAFDNATFEVRLAMLPTDPNADVRLYAVADPSDQYVVVIQNTMLSLTIIRGGGQMVSYAVINPTNLRYARIRADAGTIYVDIAASPGVWATPLQHAADIPTTMLSVGFAAGIDAPGTSGFSTAQFDDALVQTSRCN